MQPSYSYVRSSSRAARQRPIGPGRRFTTNCAGPTAISSGTSGRTTPWIRRRWFTSATGSRVLFEARRPDPSRVAEPTSLLRHGVSRHAQHPRRLHPPAHRSEARGGHAHVPLEDSVAGEQRSADLSIALDEALDVPEEPDRRLVRVVEYRFFSGTQEKEIAELMDLSPCTIRRDWRRRREGCLRVLVKLYRTWERRAGDAIRPVARGDKPGVRVRRSDPLPTAG